MSDFFCGAGGSSTGAVNAGVQVRIAANHSKLAISSHQENHPLTEHAIKDLHEEKPSFFPRTDIGWFSPDCTKWSQASGKAARPDLEDGLFEDPLSEGASRRSRMLMFDVPRFTAHHRYELVIVENVVDVAVKPHYRLAFDRWLREMRSLDEVRDLYLNSMHAHQLGDPAPQSRDRLYVVCWRKGNRAPDLERWTRPYADCPTHGRVQAMQWWKDPKKTRGRYRQQYLWRCPRVQCRNQVVEPAWLPAASAIDWSIRGERIGDRRRPLAPKTMARIEAGLRRYAGDPHLTVLRSGRPRPIAVTDVLIVAKHFKLTISSHQKRSVPVGWCAGQVADANRR